MADGPWPDELDLSRPNGARVYDYLLGGAHNFQVDRDHAQRLLAANPEQQYGAQANRAFLRRVVEWCLDRGVRQFLDLGSGVPTVGNVHEIAHAHDPAVRVAYVDCDPIAVAHSTEVVDGLDTVSVTRADLTRPLEVLAAEGVAGLLDLDEPVALLAIACLHFIGGDAERFMAVFRERLAPGSVLAISHGSDDVDDPDHAARMRAVVESFRDTASPVTLRSRAELRELLGDLAPVEPGIVDVTDWPRAGLAARPAATWAAVAVKE
ncbi:SAM-dependent methyltransferase [Actinomycetospora soli]|uniref:SAM-dependent methyltransferase n=1 Tax=Actinomycetospora soli TaxID=2893887 RepID=UPI001E4F46C0|nr:SAM-dependent methyltransferase [Actinomycetospora soli]MCD2189560.1 SAM-dependent methyltransferase [Actinomycetospora soli]